MLGRTGRVLLRTWLIAVCANAWLAPLLVAQTQRSRSVIDGFVSDTGLVALSEASIAVLGSSVRVATGDNGRFRINAVPAGRYILTVHRVGYVPVASAVEINEGDTLRLSFALNRIVTPLDTVVVTATRLFSRLSGFEARRKFGFGTFLTQEDIERRRAVFVSDVLHAIPDISIRRSLKDGDTAHNTRFGNNCPFQVVLDEILLPTPTDLDMLPSPRDVAGIEIYFGTAMIPLQYRSTNSNCGMIIIWTKGE